MDPGPNIPEMLAVIQHLKHVPFGKGPDAS
jgi:hypothetical protein